MSNMLSLPGGGSELGIPPTGPSLRPMEFLRYSDLEGATE